MNAPFSGLDLNLGNLYRLSDAKSRSISPENFTGAKGKGGMATEGHRRQPGARARPGLESLALHRDRARREPPAGRHRRPRRHPADLVRRLQCALAQPDPAHLLGRPGEPIGRMPARRFLRHRAGTASRRSLRSRSASIRAAPSIATGRCRSGSAARITLENRDPDEAGDPLLPDQLYADRRARGRRLFPRPVPPHQSAALQDRLHHARWRRRAGATMSAPTWPGASTTPAGGAKARSSSSWMATRQFPTICGTGTEDYFCGAYNFDGGVIDPDMTSAYREYTTPYAGLPQVIAARRHLPVADSASACIAGTSWTRSASTPICG